MYQTRFQPTLEGETRLLLLIEAFSRRERTMEGRTKLAKLDFLIRYPSYFTRALRIRRPTIVFDCVTSEPTIESRMLRYRFGPWDPAHFALLGRLIGKGLVETVPYAHGIGFKVTQKGRNLTTNIKLEPAWNETSERVELLRKHFNLSGASLKKFIYENFPEVTQAKWGQSL